MSTQIDQARKSGYSDQEIVDFLSKKDASQAQKFKTAKQHGYSAEEILNHFQKPPEPKADERSLLEKTKAAGSQYGTGVAGGAGGVLPDILNLVKEFGLGGVAGNALIEKFNPKGTEELTQGIQKDFNVQEPQNSLERILKESGQFGGQEGAIGTGIGGPGGGVLGLAHGSASGAFYGSLKELGVPDEAALGLTAFATVSPIAFQKLWPKIKDSFGKISESLAKKPPPIPKEPPPPPGAPVTAAATEIKPGTTLPETRSAFGDKEKLIEQLAEKPKGAPLGVQAQVAVPKPEAPSLQGRVSTAPELGEVIAKEPFHTEAEVTRKTMKEVQAERNIEKDIVRDEYAKAEEITKTHNDTFPELAKQNDERIHKLEHLEKRSAGEEAVYQDSLALRRVVGEEGALISANASRLMKQANSFSQKVNYELPYAGYKGQIKEIVHQMNNSVINSLDRAGLNSAQVKRADKTYGRFADRFMSDELSPYLARKVLNPEELGRRAVSDEATHKAIKKALGSRKSELMAQIDRELVHQKLDKYFKDPEKVNSREYQKDLKNLAERIGKERTADADHFLRQRQLNHERKLLGERKIKETQLAREKLPPKGQPTPIEKRIGKESIAKTPEDLDKLFKKRSDIRRLRRELEDKGLSKEFDKLAEQKIEEIFKEGGFGEKKVTGLDMQRIIDKNHEVLSELMGEKEVSLLYKAAKEAGKQEITQEIIKEVIKATGKTVAQFFGLGKLIKLIPLRHI
jgi:hypothetical protein